MKGRTAFCLVLILALAAAPFAAAQEGETYETQETVYNVTLIRVYPNMGSTYLNNLKRTWVNGVKAAMAEGLTTDYKIYQTVNGGDQGYNLLLMTEHPNLAAFDATAELRAKFDRIQAKVEAMIPEEESDEITEKVYPNIREILSDRWVREIKFIEGEGQ
jgi:hypothetical protein